MAKKEQKKPSKKVVKAKKANTKTKKAAAPAKKVTKAARPDKKAASRATKPAAPAIKAAAPEKKAAPKTIKTTKFFSVAEFVNMTYLTEYGVMHWLKQGLLKGQQNDAGDWQIDASNLEVPNVKRLIR